MQVRLAMGGAGDEADLAPAVRAAGWVVLGAERAGPGPVVGVCGPDGPVGLPVDYVLAIAPQPVPFADDYLPPPVSSAALVARLAVAARLLAAESQLKDLEHLRVAVDHANEMMFRVDIQTCIRDVNAAACRRLGFGRDELLRMSICDISPNHDPTSWRTRWETLRARGTSTFESFQRTSSGEIVPVAVSLVFLDGHGLGEDFICSFVRDLTEQKKIEANLVLADRLHALGLLAASTAHEINNPLTYVTASLSYAQAELSREKGEPDRAALAQAIQEAADGARRVARIVSGLKSFSRTEATETSGRAPSLHAVRLDDVLETARRMTSRLVEAQATVTRTGPLGLWVRADAPRLVQVFVNLLINAAQAMPARPREENLITLAVRPGTIAGGQEPGGGPTEVQVEVHDNGQGIPPAVRARIFDPFFTTKPAGVGTGLGLAVCHGIITGLGGRIEVESEPGAGALFRVFLPVAQPPARTTQPPHGLSALRDRVLIVDGDVRQLNAFARLLGRTCLVSTARSGDEALDLLRAGGSFELVLCDLNMPTPGTFVRDYVATERPELLPVFYLVTGGVFTAEAAAYLQAHSPRILEKPVDTAVVLALLGRTPNG